MPNRNLKTVTRTQGSNRALKDGGVRPKDFGLAFEEVPVLVNAFRRMVRDLEFDVCEMAITTYLCAKANGTPFTALPIPLVRGFHHGAIVTSQEAGVQAPKDLEGRRVGVNRGYTVTTGVWARGVLQDEHGVDLDAVTWVPSGDEHVAAYRPPANVVPMEPGRQLADLVGSGELAAGVGAGLAQSGVVELIPNATAAGFAALQRDSYYPINHLVVVRDDLLTEHPDLAADLFGAFTESKNRYIDRLGHDGIHAPTATDLMYRKVMEITGDDPLPYGIPVNRAMIEKLITHAMQQHILERRPTVESLFAEGTRELTG